MGASRPRLIDISKSPSRSVAAIHVDRKRRKPLEEYEQDSVELRVFDFGLFQDADIGVGVFPEREKILICSASLGGLTLQDISAGKAEVRERSDGLVQHNSAVVENFLKLRRSFAALMSSEVRFATHKDWVHRGPIEWTLGRNPELIWRGGIETLDGFRSVSFVECDFCLQGREVVELHEGVFGKPRA